MAVTKEQLQQLQGLAGQYGGANSQQFKDYVNTKLGAGGYDKLVNGLKEVKSAGGIDAYNQQQPKTLTPEQVTQQNQQVNTQAQNIANKPVNDGQTTQITPQVEQNQPKIETTKVTTETTPTGTVKTTETPTGTPKIESIEQFKQAGGGLSNLEQLVENRYGTVATQNADGSLTAEINGEKFKWTLDASGNPVKQSLGKVGVEEMKQTQLDPNNLFNQIRSGQVPTKDIQNTDEYKKSKQRADNLGRFENMSAKDLSYSINNGDLLPGTQTYNDLKTIRPDLVAEAEKLNTLNSALTTTEKSNTDVLTKITEQIFKIFNGDTTTLKTKLSQNSEVLKLNSDMATKKNELNSLKDSINNAYRDIEKELSGSGATKGYIQALASRRTEDLTRDYNTKLNEYNTMAGQLQTITEMVGDELQQEEKQQAKQLQALEFTYGIAKDELAYKRGLDATQKAFENQKELLQLQQDFKNADIQTSTITDPATGKISLINSKTGETIKTFNTGLAPIKTGQNYELKEFGGKVYRFNQTTGEYETIGGGTPTTYTPTNRYDFIKKSEGFRSEAYQDSTGKWTIGYGFTSLNGKPVKQGDTMTQAQADKAMVDIANKYTNFKNFIKVPLSEEQQTALNSFEYNLGQNIWKGDGKTIIDKINSGDFAGAGQEMLKFNKALNPKTGQKEVLNGLTNRRQREASLLQQTGGQATGYTNDEINKFKYSERLTPNEQNNYLKEQGLVDKYMKYNANRQETEGGLLEGINSIQDITFPEKTTEFKTKSYNYGTRMDEANKFLSQMDEKYKNSWTSTEYLAPRGEWIPNFLKTDDRQSFEQAQRNFINAVLRQESGAVISDQEFANAKKQYFPSAGDSEATLNQKKSNREMAIYNMLKSSGKDELGRDIGNIWKELNKVGTPTKTNTQQSNQYKANNGKVYQIKINP